MIKKTLVSISLAFLFLSCLALGGYDLSGGKDAKNLSLAQFDSLGMEGLSDEADLAAGVPQVAATAQGTELAAYTDQAPSATNLGKVMPFDIMTNYPMYIFYDGGYLGWSDFITAFPSNKPGLWIERAAGWSWYATLPLGGWTQELLYVPSPSPVTLYEIYPGGFVRGYDLGFSGAGYHLVWYYADSVGRHSTILATNSGYSNAVIIDVYSRIIPTPKPVPDPKKECESRSTSTQTCEWRNGRCQCYMKPVPNPVAECQARSNDYQTCDWSNGACHCVPKPAPNPVAECQARSNDYQTCDWSDGACHCVPKPAPNPVAECEERGCQWYDGDCHCDIPGPVPNPSAECESNPQCDYVNGNCYCRGVDPEPEPEPMPGPVPNPSPDPEPMPGPVYDQYTDYGSFDASAQCSGNPGCYWSGGRCHCTGFGGDGYSGGSDSSETDYSEQY